MDSQKVNTKELQLLPGNIIQKWKYYIIPYAWC
jgi:hypothetical protein